MSRDPRNFKAPFLSQQHCWNEADQFRRRYTSGEIPVDILAIVEFDLEQELRVISGLKEDSDVDALLLADWQTLVVDYQQFLDDRFSNRLRFSIAHEIGHYVLHRAVLEKIPRNTPQEWIAFMLRMPEDQYSYLEYQANQFAGRLLVPPDELRQTFENVLCDAEKKVPRSKIGDAHLDYLCIPLAKHFAVSGEVIRRRLRDEKLWPPTLD